MVKINLKAESKISFPKGTKVLFTDPCYIFSHSISKEMDQAWGDMCYEMFSNEGREKDLNNSGTIELDGVKVMYSGTAHGDGYYSVNTKLPKGGNGVGVDAGLICVCDYEEALKIHNNPNYIMGEVVELVEDTTFVVDGDSRSYGMIRNINETIVLDTE